MEVMCVSMTFIFYVSVLAHGHQPQVQSSDVRPVSEKEQAVTDANAPQALKEFREKVHLIRFESLLYLHGVTRSKRGYQFLSARALW